MFLTRYLTLESYLKVSYSDNFRNNLCYVSSSSKIYIYIYDMRVIDIRNFFFFFKLQQCHQLVIHFSNQNLSIKLRTVIHCSFRCN